MVRLVQLTFRYGTLPEELSRVTMVLILKGSGEYRGIGVVEVTWKVCAAVVNCRLKRSVKLPDALHVFRKGRVIETATLEANLDKQLVRLAHKPIFQVFLYVRKVYDSLYRGWCLEILGGYGLGLNMARLLTKYWDQHRIVTKLGKFLGKEFWTGRGLMQTDPVSPMIFNIVMDAVVRALFDVVCGPQEAQNGLGWASGERNLVF